MTNILAFFGGITISWLWFKLNDALAFDEARKRLSRWLLPYDLSKSNRIMGVTQDRIVDGQWTQAILSLWRARYYEYFILEVDELNEKKMLPIKKTQAIDFIKKHADAVLAARLLRDWFSIEPLVPVRKEETCLGCE